MRSSLRRSPLAVLLCASFACAGTSWAAPPPPPPKPPAPPRVHDAADDWFDKGSAAYDAHDLKAAEAAFLEAWKLKKTQDIAANLGAVELELGQARQATGHLAYAVQNAAPTDSQQVRRSVKDRFD